MKKLLFIFFLFGLVVGNSQNKTVDSLLLVLKTAKEDTNKVNLLILLCDKDVNNPKSIEYVKQAYELSEKLNYTSGMATSLYNIGGCYFEFGEISKSLNYLQKSLKLYESLKDKQNMIAVLDLIGSIYQQRGDITGGMELMLKSLKLAEELKDKKRIAAGLNGIGMTLALQGDTSTALNYYKRSFDLWNKLNDKRGASVVLNNIGAMFLQKGDTVTGLSYLIRALKMREEIRDKKGIAKSLATIGVVYRNQNKYNQAIECYKRSIEICEELHYKAGLANAYHNLARVYLEQKKYSLAEDIGEKALLLSREVESPELIRNANKQLANIYSAQGKYKEAYKTYIVFKQMADSINNAEIKKSTLKKQIEYEFEKKESEAKSEQAKKDAIMLEQNKLKDLELKQKNILVIGLCLLIVLSLGIGWLIFRQNKLKSKQTALQLEQKLLRLQMNPHFIFNSLIAIESFIHTKQPDDAREYLSDFAKLMRLILENSREEYVSLQKEIDTLNYYLRLQKLTLEDTFTYSVTLGKDLDTEEIQLPPMLIQPFIENAIKHGVNGIANGHIEILITKENENLIIEIKDNGKGIFENESKSSHTSLATTITKERLLNINLRKKQKINFKIQSLATKGTQVIFTIPLV